MKNLAAIILAAGKGTRMKSEKPKVIFPFAEKPMIQRVINTANQAECDKIVAVVGYQKEQVIKTIEGKCNVTFVEQKEQNGTGHAIIVTKPEFENFSGDIFILCGDVPLLQTKTLEKMHAHHTKTKAACTVLTAVMDDALKYGRIIRNEDNNVKKIVEFKDATEEQKAIQEINSGIYIFDAESLFTALEKIDNNNQQKEYYLTDTLEQIEKTGKLVTSVLLEDMMEVSGINSQEQLANLETEYYQKIKKHWLNNGVSIENPNSVIIGEDVQIEPGVEIYANTIIKGRTKIKSGTKIGANCYLYNCQLEENVRLAGYNIILNRQLSANASFDFSQKG
jgi:bifunctional UDP-N-acetylglucosamine pyrophosphorylase / glucosamine-1-phosphate N-acetyltransferase